MTEKVDKETALEELERMCKTADVTIDHGELDDDDVEDVQGHVDFFVKAIQRGDMSVTEDGMAVVHLADDKEMQFRVPGGKEIMIVAAAPEHKRMQALVNLAATLTNKDSRQIEKLEKRPFKLAVRLAGFLSAD